MYLLTDFVIRQIVFDSDGLFFFLNLTRSKIWTFFYIYIRITLKAAIRAVKASTLIDDNIN